MNVCVSPIGGGDASLASPPVCCSDREAEPRVVGNKGTAVGGRGEDAAAQGGNIPTAELDYPDHEKSTAY